jgi:Mrp family chromosome partitioning ATPase
LKLASVGALAGAVLPAIFFILQSLIVGSRYKYSDDTHVNGAADIPLIGIVPSLNADAHPGDELSQAAAQSIHQIRVSLTSDSTNGDESAVYLVTSASAGEGKTSLSMSIGLSFAGAGVRTLLIDCDMLGRQLTECLGALDKPGLQEALGSGTLHNRIHKISRKLYYVPTGQVRRADACSISPARLRLVLAQARRHFDVVLIDSGPILGSVEASVLAREVDGVLFAVSQNQRRAVVERAIQRLASLDARLDGLIFNRARPEDFESSSYGSSSGRSTVSWKSNGNYIEDPPEGKFGQFGLLVQAVASTMHRNAALEKSTVAKS